MLRLRTSTVLAIVAVSIACVALVLFSSGVIQSQLNSSSGGNSFSEKPINTISTAIPANTLFEDHIQHPTLAAVNYTQQILFVRGNVSAVENKGGLYRSC